MSYRNVFHLSICLFVFVVFFKNFDIQVAFLFTIMTGFIIFCFSYFSDLRYEKQKKIYTCYKEYESALNYLKVNPQDPDIRSICCNLAEKFYITRNPNITVLELQNYIRTDFEIVLGHLNYA